MSDVDSTTVHRGETTSTGRGRPSTVFAIVDVLFHAVSVFVACAGYMVTCFALFAAISAGYAGYAMRDVGGAQAFMESFLQVAGYLVVYVAAPIFAVSCAWLFVMQAWRKAWERPGIFEERGLHPLVVGAAIVLFVGLAWNAHVSLGGQWRQLPPRFQMALGLDGHEARSVTRDRGPSMHVRRTVQSAVILAPDSGPSMSSIRE